MDAISEGLATSIKSMSNASFSIKLSISFGIAFVFYYKARVVKPPKMIGKDGHFRRFVEKTMPVVHESFAPNPLLFATSLQTIAASVFKKGPEVRWNFHEDLDLPDNGQIHLSWINGHQKDSQSEILHQPIVILLPGLTGNNEANYMKQFAKMLDELGYRGVVFTYRGMGGKGLKTAKTYCACYTDDITYVVKYVKDKYPYAPIMGTGVSLGGMILFHYLASTGKDSGLMAAMIISAPWNPFESMKTLTTLFNRVTFNRHLTQSLLRSMENYLHMFVDKVNVQQVMESNTIHEFDESFTSRVFGFESLDHYYSTAMLADKVDKIQTPLLCLNSYDDPFSPGYVIPVEDIAKSDYITMVLTERGGHVGFIDTMFAQGSCYMDRMFSQYVDAVFTNSHLLMQENDEQEHSNMQSNLTGQLT